LTFFQPLAKFHGKEFMSGLQSPRDKRATLWIILAICTVSALANVMTGYFVTSVVRFPLYLDTVFTVAVCFSFGLLPGLLTGALLSPLLTPLIFWYFLDIPFYLTFTRIIFTICVVLEVVLVCFFLYKIKTRHDAFLKKPSLQSFMGLAPFLLTLVAFACILISVSGGIIDFVLAWFNAPRTDFPEDTFKLGLLRNNIPLLPAAILSRIPINIVDRFIVIFGGFGISLLYRKLVRGISHIKQI
jgi:hypothetical protein